MPAFGIYNIQLSLRAYRYTAEFTDTAWAWEYLRRNPCYRVDSETRQTERASNWSLLRFEDTELDARHADVFWQSQACKQVLPLIADAKHESREGQAFSMDNLRCRMIVHDDGDHRHILLRKAAVHCRFR